MQFGPMTRVSAGRTALICLTNSAYLISAGMPEMRMTALAPVAADVLG